jgi:hypothetical protein
MSQFNYSDYQNVVNRAQSAPANNAVKVGFFKLKNDKDEALVRLNVTTLDELQFATVHQLGAAQKWMKISCLNPVGNYADSCPLCKKVADGDTSIGKAAKKVYVQMLVSYKDATTGQFSEAIPVIWERPAGFSREIANLLRDYGDLKAHVFKVTRNGASGSMQTTYSIAYIPLFDKPETVPTDFSAFANFKINKHSYWEKTLEEIETFLATGSFPEVEKVSTTATPAAVAEATTVKATPAAATPAPAVTPAAAPATAPAEAPASEEPAPAPATDPAARPARNFGGFSF